MLKAILATPVQTVEAKVSIVADDTSRAMLCPLSGTLMTKYRIAADTEHRLDLSPSINAVWLDKGEWNMLKEKGLANRLSEIFTDHWQRGVREDETSEVLEDLYESRFGEHYEQVKAFKQVIQGMSNRQEVVAYLLSD